jgi:hypothetical protein
LLLAKQKALKLLDCKVRSVTRAVEKNVLLSSLTKYQLIWPQHSVPQGCRAQKSIKKSQSWGQENGGISVQVHRFGNILLGEEDETCQVTGHFQIQLSAVAGRYRRFKSAFRLMVSEALWQVVAIDAEFSLQNIASSAEKLKLRAKQATSKSLF